MKKWPLFMTLVLFAFSCFSVVVFSYKHATEALKIPKLEDECLYLKQEVNALELKIKALKTPQKLLEAKNAHAKLKLKFPKKEDVYVLNVIDTRKAKVEKTKSSTSYSMPIARMIP